MIYIESFILPTEDEEWKFHMYNYERQRSCYNNYYPFSIFRDRDIDVLYFKNITLLCGSNGSGKSTLLNLIAEKLELKRFSNFNKSSFYNDFLEICKVDIDSNFNDEIKSRSKIITSDDIFNILLSQRDLNDEIDERKRELIDEYYETKYSKIQFKSLDDSKRVKAILDTRNKTASKWIKTKLMENVIGKSNGEEAYNFFLDEIKENALYLIDEPENSLSPKRQIEFRRFIEESARYFNCQFIISTHSPIVSSIEGARIYDLDTEPFRECKWEELENVKIYKDLFSKKCK